MPEMLKMIPEDEMEEAVKQLPPEAIELMKKMVAVAEEHQAKEKSSTSESSEAKGASKESKEGSKAYEAIEKIGNSDEASSMRRAIFIWDEKTANEALKEICKDSPREGQWRHACDGSSGVGRSCRCQEMARSLDVLCLGLVLRSAQHGRALCPTREGQGELRLPVG